MDIVKYIEQEVETLNWIFSYGNTANQNLIEGEKDLDGIYFLLDPVITDEPDVSEFGGDGDVTHELRFLLLVQSDLDNVYFEQKGQLEGNGKYEKNILPLKTKLKLFKDVIDCSIYERSGWRQIEGIDMLGTNFDGIIVTTTLKENAE